MTDAYDPFLKSKKKKKKILYITFGYKNFIESIKDPCIVFISHLMYL
jgi:hypothetical protein